MRHAGTPQSLQVYFQSAWNGIDVSWGQVGGALKDSFIVHKWADPSDVVTAISGATSLYIDPNSGVLDIRLPNGQTLTEAAPVIYTVASNGAQTCRFQGTISWKVARKSDFLHCAWRAYNPA